MSSAEYNKALAVIRAEVGRGTTRPQVIDEAVQVMLLEPINSAADLLRCLSDDVENEQGMYTLIHAAEASDDPSYVRALLSVFIDLFNKSPRLLSVVLMRALNNDRTRVEAVRQLRDASPEVKQSVRIMCERINSVSPEFMSRTIPLIFAAM